MMSTSLARDSMKPGHFWSGFSRVSDAVTIATTNDRKGAQWISQAPPEPARFWLSATTVAS
jgi:hypothetical protein